MGAVMGRQLHCLHRPALSVRKILGLQALEELQHAGQALLVIDVLDGGMSSGRVGRYVVLQGDGNMDQSSGHKRFLEGFRRSTGCAGPESSPAPSKAMRSTRSPTISACPARTSSTTCGSATR